MKNTKWILFLAGCFCLFSVSAQHNNQLSSAPVSKFITLSDGQKLNYAEQGEKGSPTFLFLHGLTDSWHSFDEVMKRVPATYHVIALTQRGHGLSDKPASGYSISNFAADAASVVRSLNAGPVIVVGHSMGGMVAQQFAQQYPELTRALVIVSSFSTLQGRKDISEFQESVNGLKDPIDRVFIEEFQRSTILQPFDSAYFNLLCNESQRVPASVWKATLDALVNADIDKNLHLIQAPALICWGEKDGYCLKEDQELMRKKINKSSLKVYENTGHAIHWEKPAEFTRDLLRFANGLPDNK